VSYREPAVRAPRLWYVVLAFFDKNGDTNATNDWVWASEGHKAIEVARERRQTDLQHTWTSWAICAEDFVEREAKGPT